MAKDKYHDIVKQGLIDEGWDITDDPLYLELFTTTLQVDLGAERLIGATKNNRQIAVEIKSFISLSRVGDFYKALGQFKYYHLALEHNEPERVLYLAIPADAYSELIKEPLTVEAIHRFQLKLIIYSVKQQKIIQWIG
jgi:hypothetical protein